MDSTDRKLKGLLVHALDSEERFEAVQALRQLGDIRVLEPFLDFILTDPDDDVRRESAWGVGELVRAGKIPFLQAVQPLLLALEDDDPMVKLGGERARAALTLLLNDSDFAIRDMAESALATLDINQGL